jgi:hypothetical protein
VKDRQRLRCGVAEAREGRGRIGRLAVVEPGVAWTAAPRACQRVGRSGIIGGVGGE